MSFRAIVAAALVTVAVPSSGIAEFTTPSLDQWGDGAKMVGPREWLATAREPEARWISPTSVALVSGAPVALHLLPPTSTSVVASGEELILTAGWGRGPAVYEVYAGTATAYAPATVYLPAPSTWYYTTQPAPADPAVAVVAPAPSPSGAVVVAPPAAGTVAVAPPSTVAAPAVVAAPVGVTTPVVAGTYVRTIEIPGYRPTLIDEGVVMGPGVVPPVVDGTYASPRVR